MPKKKRTLISASLLESMTAVQDRLEGNVGDEANSEIRTKRQRGIEKRGGKAPVVSVLEDGLSFGSPSQSACPAGAAKAWSSR